MTDLSLPALPIRPARPRVRRVMLRALARLTRPLRRALDLSRWPIEWRAALGRATPEENAALQRIRQAAAEKRALEQHLNALAGEYKRLIINALTRVGVSYMYKDEGHRRFSRVQFHKPCSVTQEAIYFRVKTDRLPYHVSIDALCEESTLNTLCAATGRPINVIWNRLRPEDGFWFIVELRAGVRGIPRQVEYAEMLAEIADKAPPLTIPIGRGIAGKMEFANMATLQHLLIGGATAQGKSVWMKQALMTLLLRNKPKRLKLVMIDLKGGVELGQFKKVPHLLLPVVKENDAVIPALQLVVRELKSRLRRMEERGAVNISDWNRHSRMKMDYWLIVIDELASLMLDPELRNEVDRLLAVIAAQGRAPGIHIIAATQRPDTRVITGLIKANFPARIAFAVASSIDSRIILDTGDAYGIGPAGRMIFYTGKEKLELQGPYVSPSLVDDTVKAICGGEVTEALDNRKRHNFSHEDFFRHALTHHEGRFPIAILWEELKVHGVSLYEIKQVALQYENNEMELDGVTYRLDPPVLEGRKQSRKLVRISEEIKEGDEDEPMIPTPTLDEFQPIVNPVDLRMKQIEDDLQGIETSAPSEKEEGEVEPE